MKKVDSGKDESESRPSAFVCDCKVSRKATEYGFTDLYRKLPDLWLGQGLEEHSLRELQEKINVNILRSAIESAGNETVVGEVESKYDVLTSDKYTAGEKTEVKNHLLSKGVDVEKVQEDFISHQSVANHFYNCLDKKKGRSTSEESDDVGNVRSLKRMARDRLEQMVEKHRKSGDLDLSNEYRIETDFYVVDENGNRTELTEAIKKAE